MGARVCVYVCVLVQYTIVCLLVGWMVCIFVFLCVCVYIWDHFIEMWYTKKERNKFTGLAKKRKHKIKRRKKDEIFTNGFKMVYNNYYINNNINNNNNNCLLVILSSFDFSHNVSRVVFCSVLRVFICVCLCVYLLCV